MGRHENVCGLTQSLASSRAALLTRVFDEELERLLGERGTLKDAGDESTFREARRVSESMIQQGHVNPI